MSNAKSIFSIILERSISEPEDSTFELDNNLFAKVRPAIINALFLSLIESSSVFNSCAALINWSFSSGGHAR